MVYWVILLDALTMNMTTCSCHTSHHIFYNHLHYWRKTCWQRLCITV